MRTRFLLYLITASLSVVAARSVYAQDPMAKWKPSVGDKFVYLQQSQDIEYVHGFPSRVISDDDTITMEILNTDSTYNSSYLHVVTVWNSFSNSRKPYKSLYYFHPGRIMFSTHPLAIDFGDTL